VGLTSITSFCVDIKYIGIDTSLKFLKKEGSIERLCPCVFQRFKSAF
jgi:hypothetical protein